MKGKFDAKKALIIGFVLIFIAILIGLIFQHDIAFVFAGLGIVIIGIAALSYINKGE